MTIHPVDEGYSFEIVGQPVRFFFNFGWRKDNSLEHTHVSTPYVCEQNVILDSSLACNLQTTLCTRETVERLRARTHCKLQVKEKRG